MSKVTLYSSTNCSFCERAKALLTKKAIPYQEVDLTGDPQARKALIQRTGQMTVPQIFIGETHIGGFMELAKASTSGRLNQLLSA